MNKSETTAKLAAALSRAQAQIKGAVKDHTNTFFKSSYATLESVVEACRQPLADNELSVAQTFDIIVQDGQVIDVLTTTLMHSSGEWISGRQRMLSKDQTAQGLGSAASYNRRYGLSAMIGIVQVDDDGNEASGRATAPTQGQQQSRPTGPLAQATRAPQKNTNPTGPLGHVVSHPQPRGPYQK